MLNRKYLSHDIINEQIEIMAGRVLNASITDIKNAGIFCIIADETRDISEWNSLLFAYVGLTITTW